MFMCLYVCAHICVANSCAYVCMHMCKYLYVGKGANGIIVLPRVSVSSYFH